MSSFTLQGFCIFGFFTYLVLFSYVSITSSVSLDVTELRNKVAKIKVNPRGNLWATGHFMGKKSVVDSAVSPPEEDATISAFETSLNPQHFDIDDLYQEVLKTALQTRLNSEDTQTKNLDTALFMNILENYIQGNRKQRW